VKITDSPYAAGTPEHGEWHCAWLDDLPTTGTIRAEVWECDDDWCGCTEARVTHWVKSDNQMYWHRTNLWQGQFHSDHQWAESNRELNRLARHLRRHHNAEYHRIAWPWDT